MDILLFLGRLHPLIVHLPIGFLIMAIILEVLSRKEIISGQEKSIVYILFFGTLSGLFSIIFGWLLANVNSYDDQILFFHRWLGIITTVLSAIAWWSKDNLKVKIYNFTLAGLGISLLVTGHLGGTLTHGPDYLSQVFINENNDMTSQIPSQPDSIIVYQHLIQPIFKAKCYDCHNSKKSDGSLDLTNLEYLSNGGRDNHIIKQNVLDSEIFLRTTLPQSHKKFMPKKGEQLTFGEISLLIWWIQNGANLNGELMEYDIPEEIKYILIRDYNLNPVKRPFIEKIKINPLSLERLNSLNSLGWEIAPLAQNNHLLEVSVAEGHALDNGQIAELYEIKDYVTWLNLGNQGIRDDDLTVISNFSNLTRLRIENNYVSDAGVKHLVNLQNLVSLNIYNNPITDDCLDHVEQLQNLKKIFLWKTNITSEGIDRINQNRSDIVINAGYP